MAELTISITMPERLAMATLQAAETVGQRTGEASIRLDHFIVLSERAYEKLLGIVQDKECGGAERTPERGCEPAPAPDPVTPVGQDPC